MLQIEKSRKLSFLDRYYDRSRTSGYDRYDPYDRYYSRYDFRNYRPWDETYRYRRTLFCLYIHVVAYLCTYTLPISELFLFLLSTFIQQHANNNNYTNIMYNYNMNMNTPHNYNNNTVDTADIPRLAIPIVKTNLKMHSNNCKCTH